VTSVEALAPVLAAATSLALAAMVALPAPRGRLQGSFALGMLAFAAEGVATYWLLDRTETPEDRQAWLRAVVALGVLAPLAWALFVARLAHPAPARLPALWRAGLGMGALLAGASAVAAAVLPAFLVADVPGPFHAVRLDRPGQGAIGAQLLLSAGVLAGLERCLRASRGTARWRVKYLALGVGGIFLVRFYLLSHALLFHVVLAVYLATGAAAVLVGNLVVAVSVARHRLLGVELAISRQVVYRSVVLGVLGAYLIAIGALGWILGALGVSQELFWGSLAVFVSALGLAAVLLSENVRWRVKRFIALHFYRAKYDYRLEWARFTARLGSLVTVEELAPEVLAGVAEAVGAPSGAVYVAGVTGSRELRLAAALGVERLPAELPAGSALVEALARERAAVPLENGHDDPVARGLAAVFPEGSLAVPLAWRGTLLGVMVLGRERTGSAYGAEDREFLATVGEQLAGAIATAQLSETAARAREFEAFHRLTSFVVHDLKNSTSALSMLSQNALANFEDPEFQRDAILTLSRTVERMKRLLGRLAAAPERGSQEREAVDLPALVLEAVAPLASDRRIRVVTELGATPPVSGDPDALLRVLQNLVTNAREAMSGTGTMTLRTYAEDGWSVCAVTDTGCGMREDFVRRSLFAPFRSTKAGGWGIGLYQAKTIVEAHGGRIEVQSREGEGTTFRVRLPAGGDRGGQRAGEDRLARARAGTRNGSADRPPAEGALAATPRPEPDRSLFRSERGRA
jgi:putative PEP-CTERM system histidine kinase